MKTEEDEAFDDLARKQGSWGGGFPAKRQMAMDKIHAEFYEKYVRNRTSFPKGYSAPKQEPAEWLTGCPTCGMDAGCDCDTGTWNPPQPAQEPYDQTALELCNVCGWKTLIPDDGCLNCERAQPAQESDMLTIAYQSGYYDGKKAALAGREWNFCERCGKRTKDLTVIHTCTPPQEKNNA